MERIQSINPKRVAWCCADLGITPSILATELGIPLASIERMMSGEAGVTFNQLRKIADYFGRGILFFLESEPVIDSQVHTPQFRTLANQKPELSAKLRTFIERVERQRSVYLSLVEELDDTDSPTFNPPEIPTHNPIEAARIARKWLGLTNQNNFEGYREAVEAKGILVFRSNGYNGKWQIDKKNPILGFTLYDPICPVIVIKKQPSYGESQQIFTLMHELGHLLLHKSSSIDDDRDMQSHKGQEQEANAFAGNLLVSDAVLNNIRDIDRPDEVSQYNDWLAQIRKTLGVSLEVILRRLLDVGRLQQSQYLAYRQWNEASRLVQEDDAGSRLYRHREPKHVFGNTFVRTVLDALSASYITLAKASSYLDGLKIKDIHELERHYAGL
jgi:Zn-dependent peptidase ImmA (M78 family)/plasmid maintenance system antidote protein VapI